ncbi:iron complex transport system ATP-binding protein [Hathewaya proteolytica DSM 3090]|uniref:Iron complex transport system ATP-binding protein n=1 Tax=Hathewaya proteolytica DSM 3090 TaxID=1121331 RepID=A0A1M6K9Z0_9CLOT|nr:ABC transporter ATP-binding protein [Hathewaya proteolytica]SHJ55795.1 iron complex transport system ATP-binding protein [Hathewaya proteolytica DSM 3090]
MNKNVLLKVRDLSVGYKEHKIIDNINLDIERGKIYSILGPNGCGKTTLVRTMSRSIKPKSGKVLLHDEDIFKMKTKNVAKKMAVLCQNNITMSDVTVKNLVQYGRYSHKEWWRGSSEEDKGIVEWALEKTGLLNFSNRKISNLSGGERQRAWIAMAIAQKPEILLLDEPTTYLDICHQLEIMELVSKLNKEEGITIVMVLHDINHAARYSDELVVLKDKHIYKQGEPFDILEPSVLKEVFKVEADIMKDKDNNKPVFYAKRVV